MSDQQHPASQNVQPHTNSVVCFLCGAKHIIETEGIALDSALQNGWKQKGVRIICPTCMFPKHPFKVPYIVTDERVLENDRGCFMDVQEEDERITTWKVSFKCIETFGLNPPKFFVIPSWEFHRRIE